MFILWYNDLGKPSLSLVLSSHGIMTSHGCSTEPVQHGRMAADRLHSSAARERIKQSPVVYGEPLTEALEEEVREPKSRRELASRKESHATEMVYSRLCFVILA